MPRMDVHETLVAHHRRLDELFESYLAAVGTDTARANQIFAEFESALVAHFEAEELHLFPTIEPEFPEEVLALREEHELLRRQVSQLITGGNDIGMDAATALAGRLRVHGAREDNMLYKLVNAASESERCRQIVTFLEEMHARLVAAED
jgi:hemerythrin